MEEDTISINKEEILKFITNKKLQWAVVGILFLMILITSVNVRTSNVGLLKDATTGEYIPLALDPFYFLRIAQMKAELGDNFPTTDPFRIYPQGIVPWSNEILPDVVLIMHGIWTNFEPTVSIAYVHNLSTVILYVIGLFFFFALVFFLTKSKWLALLASAFLAYTPAYLYRTMAGFSDHEAIGMMSFYITLAIYAFSIRYLGRKKIPYHKPLIGSILLGLATGLTIASWRGVALFLFIIIPMTFFLIWIFTLRKQEKEIHYNLLLYYAGWMIFTFVGGYALGYPIKTIFGFFTNSNGLLSLGILGFIITDTILMNIKHEKITQNNRVLYALLIGVVLGSVALFIMGRNPFTIVWTIVNNLINPFGVGRIGLTVAENQAPYLVNWIQQTSAPLFWMFYFGMILFGYQLSKKIKKITSKLLFFVFFILMVSGILFSKYQPSSVYLNGTSFISALVYFIPLVAFWIYFFMLYYRNELSFTKADSLIFALIFFTLISGRAATRVFFAITPFVCLMAAYFVVYLFKEFTISKDKTLKIMFVCFFLVTLYLSLVTINTNYTVIKQSAQVTGPSANIHWQGAMQWVRENTPEDAIFTHWWDYGYWVQSLGKRATVNDGGHFQNTYGGDHKVGRYVLTTPDQNTALSFFKTMHIDYLLIDPTDLGKYSAYSKIGSDNNWDRFSVIPVGLYDARRTQETANETILLYNVQVFVDEDIFYDLNNDGINDIIPGPSYDAIGNPTPKAYLGGVFLRRRGNVILQPEGVYIYNNVQYSIPLRYVYVDEQLTDFGSGLDAVISIIPSINGNSIDPLGAAIYLSPKVRKSLFAQLYLLDDAFNNYPTITLAHQELDPVGKQLAASGYNQSEFVYYQGLRGPIKIWDTTNIPDEVQVVDGFYYKHGESQIAVLDNETFVQL